MAPMETSFRGRIRKHIPVPTWSELRRLGSNRTVKTSYLWFVLVPIAAKMLHPLQDRLHFKVGEHEYQMSLQLPFSWRVFYFAALFIALGTFVFAIRCPGLVKKFKSADDFFSGGRGATQLFREFIAFLPRGNVVWRSNTWGVDKLPFLVQLLGDLTRDLNLMQQLLIPIGNVHMGMLDRFSLKSESDRAKAFWAFTDIADAQRFWSRLLCSLLYLIGFSLIAWIVWENLCFVWRYANPLN